MCRCTGPCTMDNQTGKDKPAKAAGHGEPPAASAVGVVSADPGLCWERAGWRLLGHRHVIQRRGRATQSLQGQEAIRQEAHGGVVVEPRPGASLEVVQPQLFLELLIALLHVASGSSTVRPPASS